jgi:hypothetical protein
MRNRAHSSSKKDIRPIEVQDEAGGNGRWRLTMLLITRGRGCSKYEGIWVTTA